MRILVIGGGGPIGQATVRAFSARGDDVCWTSRQQALISGQVQADRSRPNEILQLAQTRRADVVVDMTVYTADDTLPLLAALDGQIARYVMVSSSDVYRNYGLLHQIETGTPDPSPLTEQSPLRTRAFPYRGQQPRSADDPGRWMDDYDKIPLEAAVHAMASDWTVLRLPMVYGPGDRQRRFRWAIGPMLAGVSVLEVPHRWLDWTTTYGYLDNIGAAIAHASVHPKAARRVFNVVDETAVDHNEWIKRFQVATDWPGVVLPTEGETAFSRAIANLDLAIPLDVSAKRLFTELEFTPPIDFAAAARMTVADELAR